VQLEPLTDAEFERLSGILGRFDNKQPMNLEQLDGFLAALICGSEIVRPSEYPIRDGLLELKDFPHGFGGSGIEVAE
jgi:hypothetical protein